MLKMRMTLLVALMFVVIGCSEEGTTTTTTTTVNQSEWFLTDEPANAAAVAEVKTAAKEGDEVVVRGRIGGSGEPISKDSSIFTIMDLKVPHCGENPDDKCPRPWDYCCETPDTIKQNSATVKIVGDDGEPLPIDVTENGLAALDEVVIVAKVGPRPNQDVLVLETSGVYRVKE